MPLRHLLLISLLTSIFNASAQQSSIKYTYLKDKNNLPVLSEVLFYDTSGVSVLNRLDVKSLNLYLGLPFQYKNLDNQEFPVADLKGKTLQDVIPESIISNYVANKQNPKKAVDFAFIRSCVNPELTNHAVLGYNFYVRSKNDTVGLMSSFFVYNKLGKEIYSCKNFYGNLSLALVSPKGRWLTHTYGFSTQDGPLVEPGIRILDLSYRKEIDLKIRDIKVLKLTERYVVFTGYAMVGSEIEGKKLVYIDFRQNLMYTQYYSQDILDKMKMEFGERIKIFLDGEERYPEKEFAMNQIEWKELMEFRH